MSESNFTLDELLVLENGAAAITADEVNSGGIIDMGASRYRGDVVVDVSAITIAGTNDETYTLAWQGSNSATFASGVVNLGIMQLGDKDAVVAAPSADSSAGRYILPVRNEYDGTIYRYGRLKLDVAGTSPSITYKAWLAKTK